MNLRDEIIDSGRSIPKSAPFDPTELIATLKHVWFGMRPTFTAKQRRNRHRYLIGKLRLSPVIQRRRFKDKLRKSK